MSFELGEGYWLTSQQMLKDNNCVVTTLNGLWLEQWISQRFKTIPIELYSLISSFLGIYNRWSWNEAPRSDIWIGVEDKEILQHRKFVLPEQSLPTICYFKVNSESREKDWFSRLFCILGITKRMRDIRSQSEVSYSLYLSAGGKICVDGEITLPVFPECHQMSEDGNVIELLFDPGTSEVGMAVVDHPQFAWFVNLDNFVSRTRKCNFNEFEIPYMQVYCFVRPDPFVGCELLNVRQFSTVDEPEFRKRRDHLYNTDKMGHKVGIEIVPDTWMYC